MAAARSCRDSSRTSLFLNGWPPLRVVPFNIVTWSLFYEMTFYLAFPAAALVALRAPGLGAWALPAAGVVAPVAAALAGADPIVLCWSLLFCGVAAAMHGERVASFVDRVPGVLVVVAYLTVTTLSAIAEMPPVLGIVAFGAVATLVLLKCLRAGNIVSSLLTDRPLVALGRISYSFYLVHWMIVVLVARVVDTHAAALRRGRGIDRDLRGRVRAVGGGRAGAVVAGRAALLPVGGVRTPRRLTRTARQSSASATGSSR